MSQPFAPQLIYRTPDGDPTEHATAPTDDSPAAQWLLPDLAVAGLPGDNARLTVVLADVIAQPGSPRPAQMPGWLRQYYLPGPTAQRTVTGPGPVTIIQGVRMPRDVLAEARGPVVLELHWNVSWWGLRSGAGHAVLRQPLTFGTDHTTASRHVWRPPVGGIGTRSVAGIDIGTGSTAVTLYAEREVPDPAVQAWDPRQLGRASRELATLLTLAADPASGLDRAFRGQVEKACTEPFDTIVRELAETYPDDHEVAAAAVTARLGVLLPLLDDALDTAADSSVAPGRSAESVLQLREQLHRVLAAVYEIPQLFSNGLLPVDLAARPDVRAVVTPLTRARTQPRGRPTNGAGRRRRRPATRRPPLALAGSSLRAGFRRALAERGARRRVHLP